MNQMYSINLLRIVYQNLDNPCINNKGLANSTSCKDKQSLYCRIIIPSSVTDFSENTLPCPMTERHLMGNAGPVPRHHQVRLKNTNLVLYVLTQENGRAQVPACSEELQEQACRVLLHQTLKQS